MKGSTSALAFDRFICNRTTASLPTALLPLQQRLPSDPLETRMASPSIYIYFPPASLEGEEKKPNHKQNHNTRTGIAVTVSVAREAEAQAEQR